VTVWQRFSAWRRSRPFWGGLLAVLSALEILGSTQVTLDGATISIGITGLQAYVIPFMLFVGGLLAWYTQGQRHFYGLVVTFVAIYALIGVNLGGFFIGTLLGIFGGGLIFAWNPAQPVDSAEEFDDQQDDDPYGPRYDEDEAHGDVDSLLDGPMTDTLPPAMNPLRDGVPGPRHPADDEINAHEGRQPPKHAAMILIAVALSATLLAAVGMQNPANAADCATPAAAAGGAAQPGPIGQVVGGIIDALGKLFGAGQPAAQPAAAATPSPSESPTPCPTPTGGPDPTTSPSAGTSPTGAPSGSPTASPTGSGSPTTTTSPAPPVKRIAPADDQAKVAKRASLMTGTRVTMHNLVFDGVTKLPTVDPKVSIEVLQFSMTLSATDNFKLHVFGQGGWNTDLTTSKLTVKGGKVLFYTSRFRGNLLGLIPVDYTPSSLPPPIPLPIIFFTDPVIDLVFVDSPVLTAPGLKISLTKN
jgi:hypothetical protein